MIRVGVVGFTNTLPLAHGLERYLPRAIILRATPAQIADGLESERIDLGIVPVTGLPAHPSWGIVPGLGIASEGPVRSVVLHSRVPVPAIERLVTDPASRTSNLLARLWLTHRLGREPEVIAGSPDPGKRLESGDATVVIGDDALLWKIPVEHSVDLGGAWTEWTGLPFVFAVWAGPRAGAPGLAESLEACYRANAGRIPELAVTAAPGDALRAELFRSYLARSIRYRLGARETEGLNRFLSLGEEAGLLAHRQTGATHVHAD